jgi:hypothetical protein
MVRITLSEKTDRILSATCDADKNMALLTEPTGEVKYVVLNENLEQWIVSPKTLIVFD